MTGTHAGDGKVRPGVSNRYALWFGALSFITLVAVMLATGLVIWKSSQILADRLRQRTQQNYEAVQQGTLLSTVEFLRRELFTPLYDMDIEYVDRTLRDLFLGVPVVSARIADSGGTVLTDGTKENLSYGTQLMLDRRRLASAPVLIERVAGGHRVTFSIGIDQYTAGYGEIVFSDEPLKKALRDQDRTVTETMREGAEHLVEIGIGWLLLVAVFALAISYVFSRTLALPLVRLRDAARRIAAGEFDHRVTVSSEDEIGEVAGAFNEMGAKLQQRAAEVELANRSLQAAKEAAEAANRAKSDFLANMSHEMRTPLAGALGMMNLVLEMELGDEERQMLEMSKRSAESLLRLITDLLDFSRLEAGILVFERKAFSLPMTIASAVEVVSILAREKGLRLSWEMDESVPEQAHGDEGRLRQVLINLLGNAVKFTEKGEVELTVRRACHPERDDRDLALFAVRDTGIGIPPEQLEQIFGKFVQVETTKRRKYGGTGLGLAVSRQIVEIMGGKIWVVSRPGQGSTFYFTIPLDVEAKESQGENPGS